MHNWNRACHRSFDWPPSLWMPGEPLLLSVLESREQILARERMNNTLCHPNFCGWTYLGYWNPGDPFKAPFIPKRFGTIECSAIFRNIFVTYRHDDDNGDECGPKHSNYNDDERKAWRKISGYGIVQRWQTHWRWWQYASREMNEIRWSKAKSVFHVLITFGEMNSFNTGCVRGSWYSDSFIHYAAVWPLRCVSRVYCTLRVKWFLAIDGKRVTIAYHFKFGF